jgi:hypothetical protein
MLTNWSVTSQSVTKKRNSITLDTIVARAVISDLVSGDVCKAEMKFVKQQLSLTQQKVVLKDTVITVLKTQNRNLNDMIAIREEQIEEHKAITKEVNKALRRQKTATSIYQVIAILTVGTSAYLGFIR